MERKAAAQAFLEGIISVDISVFRSQSCHWLLCLHCSTTDYEVFSKVFVSLDNIGMRTPETSRKSQE